MKGSIDASISSDDLFDITPEVLVACAHELKSPLALMRQLSLAIESGDTDAESIKKLAHRITLVSERALRMTTDLTKQARLEDGLFELEPVNPIQVIEQVARELEPMYTARGRQIRVAGRSRPLLAVANRELLARIMLNFADNALHYAEPGSTVTLEARAHNGGKHIRIGVRDHGPAMTNKSFRQLLSTAGKAPQPIQNRPDSSGLGLYIAGKFAETMQGNIGLTRHSDGVTFYVDINASTQMSLL